MQTMNCLESVVCRHTRGTKLFCVYCERGEVHSKKKAERDKKDYSFLSLSTNLDINNNHCLWGVSVGVRETLVSSFRLAFGGGGTSVGFGWKWQEKSRGVCAFFFLFCSHYVSRPLAQRKMHQQQLCVCVCFAVCCGAKPTTTT